MLYITDSELVFFLFNCGSVRLRTSKEVALTLCFGVRSRVVNLSTAHGRCFILWRRCSC